MNRYCIMAHSGLFWWYQLVVRNGMTMFKIVKSEARAKRAVTELNRLSEVLKAKGKGENRTYSYKPLDGGTFGLYVTTN